MKSRRRDNKAFTDKTSLSAKRRILKILKSVVVRSDPAKTAVIICQLMPDVYVQSTTEAIVESVAWSNIGYGWICSKDATGHPSYVISHDTEANRSWATEYDNRRRLVAAISALLTRSHSLTNARRVAKNIMNHSKTAESKNLLHLPDVPFEELLIGLSASTGLRQGEVFEFIKIVASQQSNPPKVLEEIAEEVNKLINMRPSVWVKEDLSVLNTIDLKLKNDRFVMSAARGDVELFEGYLAKGQELVAIHSDLGYTALHAAADFGCKDIVEKILSYGVTANIRDTRQRQTALHFAAQSGRTEICTLLMSKGADRSLTNAQGRLPFQLADEGGFMECREMLKLSPPVITHVKIIGSTSRSVTVGWVPPVVHEDVHSRVIGYVVEWVPVGLSKDVGDGDRFITSDLTFTVHNLLPSTGHGLTIYSRSLAGWSVPSSKIIIFTQPDVPDAPPPVEVHKIAANGLHLAWHPPRFNNGSPVDFYQLELMNFDGAEGTGESEDAVDIQQCPETDGESPRSASLDEDSMTGKSSLSSESVATRGNVNKFHRLVKHRNPNFLQRYVTGLEPNRPFRCRVRCRNELGYSDWSVWCEPVVPRPGAYVLDFNTSGTTAIMRLGWFRPVLSCGRRVTLYEIQMRSVSGPLKTSVIVYKKEKSLVEEILSKKAEQEFEWMDNKSQQTPQSKSSEPSANPDVSDFVTFRDNVLTNELEIADLKAGGKYQFRVRPQIEGKWLDWELSVLSTTVSVPTCVPDAPFGIRVAPLVADDSATEDSLEATDDFTWEGELDRDPILNKKLARKDPFVSDITHNSIVIQWINGSCNGSPALEYQFECAKIRDYRPADLARAQRAAGWGGAIELEQDMLEKGWGLPGGLLLEVDDAEEDGLGMFVPGAGAGTFLEDIGSIDGKSLSSVEADGEKGRSILSCVSMGSTSQAGVAPTATATATLPEDGARQDDASTLAPQLPWMDITKRGSMLGPLAFRAKKLHPGSSYIFRLRQRNEVGWSPFSMASDIITTLVSVPPSKPSVVECHPFHLIIKWNEITGGGEDGGFPLTCIDYELEIGRLPLKFNPEKALSPIDIPLDKQALYNSVAWEVANSRIVSGVTKTDSEGALPEAAAAAGVGNGNENSRVGTDDSLDSPQLHVLADKLAPGTYYLFRVRVRTVSGWSSWSEVSDEMRTSSAP